MKKFVAILLAACMVFGTGNLSIGSLSIPYITFVFLALLILFIFVMNRTKYGKSVYAVGSNEKSARLAGINVTCCRSE